MFSFSLGFDRCAFEISREREYAPIENQVIVFSQLAKVRNDFLHLAVDRNFQRERICPDRIKNCFESVSKSTKYFFLAIEQITPLSDRASANLSYTIVYNPYSNDELQSDRSRVVVENEISR